MNLAVINALKDALEKDPDNIDLRLHMIELMMKVADWDDALNNCQAILATKPSHLKALEYAIKSSKAMGNDSLALDYEKLISVFSPSSDNKTDINNYSDKTGGFENPESYEGSGEPQEEDSKSSKVVSLRVVKGKKDDNAYEAEQETIKLDDVSGMEEVKRRLYLAFLGPLKNPEIVKVYKKSLRGGLLLYGPPGCGKTYIARATAGELGAKFISVGISDILDMYLGQSERNLHEIFETARRNKPCVLFFDEVDALGRKRSLMRESAGREVVNQFLYEMDNVNSENQSLFVMAATNHPWDVDTALRRPGRFDRTLLVLPPDLDARRDMIIKYFKDRPIEGIDIDWLAESTKGYSGADIKYLCDSSAENAMEESISTGKVRSINNKDCKKALKEIKPSTRPWFETAKNYAMFSNEGGTYDDLLEYLRFSKII